MCASAAWTANSRHVVSSERAVLTAQMEKKRATLEVSRGNFPVEIYRIK